MKNSTLLQLLHKYTRKSIKIFPVIFTVSIFLLLFSCIEKSETVSDKGYNDNLYVFILAIDGLRADKFYNLKPPIMTGLLENGTYYKNSRVSVPSQTRVNFVSLSTGTHADKHGIIGASYIDENWVEHRTDQPNFKAANVNVLVPTIFEALNNYNVKSAYIATKGYELIGGRGASILFEARERFPENKWQLRYSHDIDGSEEEAFQLKMGLDKIILNRIKEAIEVDNVRFMIANFGSLDYVGHNHGVENEWYKRAVMKADATIGKFIDFLKEQKIYNESVIIITSDHGFEHIINPENVIMARRWEPAIAELAKANIEHDAKNRGGLSFCLYIKDKTKIKETYNILKDIEWISKIYSEHNLDGLDGTMTELNFYIPGRTGDFFIDMKPTHTLSFPNKGQHGTTTDECMLVPLILTGPTFKSGLQFEDGSKLVDIAPTVLHILGIDHYDYLKADGRVLKEALNFNVEF